MKKQNGQRKSILIRLMILGICVYMIATLAGLWQELGTSRQKLRELEQEAQATANDIEELKSILADGSEAKVIEKAARERLGYVYPDEQVFIDISGS